MTLTFFNYASFESLYALYLIQTMNIIKINEYPKSQKLTKYNLFVIESFKYHN